MKKIHRPLRAAFIALLMAGCPSPRTHSIEPDAGASGGGGRGSGGTAGVAGTGGRAGTGGSVATGGANGSGGLGAGGGASSGGSNNMGGAPGNGGGGSTGSAGAGGTAAGGMIGTGGSATGGRGGAAAAGGAGGMAARGGAGGAQAGGAGGTAGGTAGGGGGAAGGGGGGGSGGRCGDGQKAPTEQCDLGAANRVDAYGSGMCTTECKIAPYCGDGVINGSEQCDAAGSGSTNLGSCNPECTGFFEKKFIRETTGRYSGNLGGPAGADQICQTEFLSGWKALIVGGGRRATVTPLRGDGQTNWVVRKYTHYFNEKDELIWRTDDVALLGVRGGQRMNLYADAFFQLAFYPWGGYDSNWVEVPRNAAPGGESGTCLGWTTIAAGESGTFPLPDLTVGRTEPCGGAEPVLCIQQ